MLREHDLNSFLSTIFSDPQTVSSIIASLFARDVASILDLGALLVWNKETNNNDLPREVLEKFEQVFGGETWDKDKATLINCVEAFCYFDTDKNGNIDLSELSEGFIKLGQGFSLKEIKQILNAIDCGPTGNEQNGVISFVEFSRAFRMWSLSKQNDKKFTRTSQKGTIKGSPKCSCLEFLGSFF